eukprot:scaffold17703_cov119-Isochrysis_galbana.AAC.7
MIGRPRCELEVAEYDKRRAELGGCDTLSVRKRREDLVGIRLADAPIALTRHSCAGNRESPLVARDAVHILVVAAREARAQASNWTAQTLHQS